MNLGSCLHVVKSPEHIQTVAHSHLKAVKYNYNLICQPLGTQVKSLVWGNSVVVMGEGGSTASPGIRLSLSPNMTLATKQNLRTDFGQWSVRCNHKTLQVYMRLGKAGDRQWDHTCCEVNGAMEQMTLEMNK